MKQLKKTLLTLVALLAVTTGAWAQTPELLVTIESNGKGTSSQTFDGKAILTFGGGQVSNDNDNWGWYNFTTAEEISLTVTGADGYTVTSCTFYTNSSSKTVEGEHPTVYVTGSPSQTYTATGKGGNSLGVYGVTKIEVYGYAASSGPKVDGPTTVDGKPQWSFTMPGGNVTLEPDYYPQATVAEGAVTAATDVKATTDAPLVTIDETKLTGVKKLMYYVSTDATAPAYDAVGWTDVLPTAENYTEAANLNVWYYPVGTDEGDDEATATYSDGDICATALTVSLGAAPTYAVTFADDLTEPDKWTASPATGVKKGTEVTVNYTGTKKVIGVKAEKKAAAPVPITVTWYNDDITGTWGKSFTKDGVTITAGFIDFDDKNFMEGGTFSTTLGNFTKIEVTTGVWNASGTGWSGSGQSGTWTGNASSVSFSGDIMGMAMGNTKFVFTIEPTN